MFPPIASLNIVQNVICLMKIASGIVLNVGKRENLGFPIGLKEGSAVGLLLIRGSSLLSIPILGNQSTNQMLM